MIVYEATKGKFVSDVQQGIIADQIKKRFPGGVKHNEFLSWEHSLGQMGMVVEDKSIPDDAQVAIEFKIPLTAKRVDFMIAGQDENNIDSVVVVELKQWDKAEAVKDESEVVTSFVNNCERKLAHPSYQAWSYKSIIEDFNATAQDKPIKLYPCAYMHNYLHFNNVHDPVLDPNVFPSIKEAPVFVSGDGEKLKAFISKYIRKADRKSNIMYEIDHGKIKPSKSLQDALAGMLRGNREFVLLDDQKLVNSAAIRLCNKAIKGTKKQVLIVEGGPGTGKSVLAINLLASFTQKDLPCQYVSKNSAPRYVYEAKLQGENKTKAFIHNLFKGSGSYVNSDENEIAVILVDEAHRLNEKSGLYGNLGENQTKEIIHAAKFSIFFIDELQRVTSKDVGSIAEIEHFAKEAGAAITKMKLESQFRCNGSDGYLAWIDNLLGIRDTANELDFGGDYDFRIFDDPCELRKVIEEKNQINNKARMVAGYCWNWLSNGKNNNAVYDITIPNTRFKASWNLGNTSTWAIDTGSVKEVGCIHTCQGLEFDYVGVIIGNDLRYKDGEVSTDFSERASTDQSLKGLKTKCQNGDKKAIHEADTIIRNTYRTLLTRGMKGCYVYCTDKALAKYFKERLAATKEYMKRQ